MNGVLEKSAVKRVIAAMQNSIGWLNPPSIVLIDEALNDYSVVWAAAGHPHAVFPTSFSELKIALAAKVMKVGD